MRGRPWVGLLIVASCATNAPSGTRRDIDTADAASGTGGATDAHAEPTESGPGSTGGTGGHASDGTDAMSPRGGAASQLDAGPGGRSIDGGSRSQSDAQTGDAGSVSLLPSCANLPRTCGTDGHGDCCESLLVPGGTFLRNYDGVIATSTNYPATISNFRLDKYEVTVGRFRRFVEVYARDMIPAGAGKNPNNASDLGWDAAWDTATDGTFPNTPFLPADQTALRASLKSCLGVGPPTWTDTVGANENMPINCVDWYEAFAFCSWDGGRLPSATEWKYAAQGGSEQRFYPWSQPPTSQTIDDSYAVICGTSCNHPENVGSKSPKGDGKWGHADLAGNIKEPSMDTGATPLPCIDCATTPTSSAVTLGDSFYSSNPYNTYVIYSNLTFHTQTNGIRCARAP